LTSSLAISVLKEHIPSIIYYQNVKQELKLLKVCVA